MLAALSRHAFRYITYLLQMEGRKITSFVAGAEQRKLLVAVNRVSRTTHVSTFHLLKTLCGPGLLE